jgi:hypothetical protein
MAEAADFFVSYTSADRAWAEWIAWHLEAEGYQVVIQAAGQRAVQDTELAEQIRMIPAHMDMPPICQSVRHGTPRSTSQLPVRSRP